MPAAVDAVRLASEFYGAGYRRQALPDRPTGSDDPAWEDLKKIYAQGREDGAAGREPRYTLWSQPNNPDAGVLTSKEAVAAPEGWRFDWGSAAIGGAGVLLLQRLRRQPSYPPPRRYPPPRYYPTRRYY